MVTINSKRLVVDASVARAAGGLDREDRNSLACTECLEEILQICHKVAITDKIKQEWKVHHSNYFLTWLTAMRSKNKSPSIRTMESDLEIEIEKLAENDQDREEMLKDLHLVEAALSTDGVVISRDDTMAALIEKYRDKIEAFKKIVWVNPENNPSEVIKWLKSGADPQNAPIQ